DPEYTVIDAGYPGYLELVGDAMASLGTTLAAIEAVVLTYHHVDHVGVAQALRLRTGAAVFVHAKDGGDAVQTGRGSHLPRRSGRELPGRPRLVHAPGHTAGNCAVILDDRGVAFVGDALV